MMFNINGGKMYHKIFKVFDFWVCINCVQIEWSAYRYCRPSVYVPVCVCLSVCLSVCMYPIRSVRCCTSTVLHSPNSALHHLCTNPCPVALPTTFCTLSHNICNSSLWNWFHVNFWRLLLTSVGSLCTPPVYDDTLKPRLLIPRIQHWRH